MAVQAETDNIELATIAQAKVSAAKFAGERLKKPKITLHNVI